MATPQLTVAVEAAVHSAFRDAIQAVLDEHGLRVNSISIDWLSAASLERPNLAVITGLRIETQS